VTVRVAFDDFAGRSVYHCHILDHEDLGMMGTLEAR
jgi:FtsP/CotA-like multicopper oxidase with cupredoxin domain